MHINSIEGKIKKYTQHKGNVVHIYCRLIDLGIKKKTARRICERIAPIIRIIYI